MKVSYANYVSITFDVKFVLSEFLKNEKKWLYSNQEC